MTIPHHTTPDAFNALATAYDEEFTNTLLGQMLRQQVWSYLEDKFPAGSRVLELACGTGEDAVWLARRGVRVTATDGSQEMVMVARAKAEIHQLGNHVDARVLSLQELIHEPLAVAPAGTFDGVLSDFGGLNTINDWTGLAGALAQLVRPGGIVVLVVMGPFCPWEIGWYLLKLRPGDAFRRFRSSTTATIGDSTIPIWYPSAKEMRRAFSSWFQHETTFSLGLWLPPSYLGHLVTTRPELFSRLQQLEIRSSRLTRDWGDHYVLAFVRK